MDEIEILKKLKEFEEESKSKLNEITKLKNKINFLEIIKREKDEKIHSNILAWFFNPKGNHNLQAAFLSNFASKIGIKLIKGKWKDAKVVREVTLDNNKRIDILITDYENYSIAIENKIGAKKREGQLSDYDTPIKRKFVEIDDKKFVFLSARDEDPNREGWIKVNYNLIYDILENDILKITPKIDDQLEYFIEQYLTILRRNELVDKKDKVMKKIEEIYAKHSIAIDLIYNYNLNKNDIIQKILIDILEDKGFCKIKIEGKNFKFLSEKLDEIINEFIRKTNSKFKPFFYEFKIDDDTSNVILFLYIKQNEIEDKLKTEIHKEENEHKYFPLVNIKGKGESNSLWRMEFLSKNEFEEFKLDNIVGKILEKISKFDVMREKHEKFFEDYFKNK